LTQSCRWGMKIASCSWTFQRLRSNREREARANGRWCDRWGWLPALQPVFRQQVRHCEHRPDIHFLGRAAGRGDPAIYAKRLQTAAFGFPRLHKHCGGGAVG
jgi:hypothetical protein